MPEETDLLSSNSDERTWAAFCHLAALSGYFFPLVGSIVGPLVVWLLRKEQYPLVDDQGKESLNFQISIIIYWVLAIMLIVGGAGVLIAGAVTSSAGPALGSLPLLLTGIAVVAVIGLFELIFIIVAAVQAGSGIAYRCPLNIRFIR